MIENFNNFNIDLADIYFCEKQYYFNKSFPRVINQDILTKIQIEFSKRTEPNFVIDVKTHNKNLFSYESGLYYNSLRSFDAQLLLEYFITGDRGFTYDIETILSPADPDYDFWFILKLRQFDAKISLIENFLKSHLERSFESNSIKFIEFINLGILQHSNFLTERVLEISRKVTEKISIVLPMEITKTKRKTKQKEAVLFEDLEDVIYRKDSVQMFLKIEQLLIESEEKYLVKGEFENLIWQKSKKDLIALILILKEYDYFFKGTFESHRSSYRKFFEKRYNISLVQQFEPKKTERINLEDYKRFKYSFIVGANPN